MNNFKIAFVGCGGRANHVIYPAFNSLPDVNIAGICDVDIGRLKATGDLYKIPEECRYGQGGIYDYQRMLNELRPDGVAVIGNPNIMYDIWEWVLQNGYNLYIEKPFGLSIHQAKMLTWLAEQKNLTTQVSFQRRSTPLTMKMLDMCRERGPIVHSVCKFYKYYPVAYTAARDHMYDDCIHAIDTVRWMNGGECIDIQSKMKSIDVPDLNFIAAILTFDNGSTGIVINSWSSGKRIFAVEMHAPGIYVEAEHEDRAYVWKDGNLTPEIYKTEEVAGSDKYFISSGVQLKARNFVDCCRSKHLCDSAFQDAIKTVRIAEKILAANTLENE